MRPGRVLAAATGVAVTLLVRRLRPFRVVVEGTSMVPTLAPGDVLLAVRARAIRRGDVVVVSPPGYALEAVKRVVGVPGQEVPLGGGARRLGPDEYLVVGDHLAASTDGRAFGPVSRPDICGVVRLRLFPRPRRV